MDEITNKLTAIFQVVNDWLKFSEAKNAILLTFSGAGITAILTYVSAAESIPNFLLVGLLISILFLCFCSLICSISFLPRTNLEHIVWIRGNPARKFRSLQSDSDNFYYFGHLLKYQDTELLNSLNRLYFDNKIQPPYRKEHLDLASQIIINSEITFLKLKLFVFALWLLIASIAAVPLSLLINFVLQKRV
jgi:hypothetical protein